MRRYLPAVVLLAACGGKSQPKPTPVEETRNVATEEEPPPDEEFGGDPYGGEGYGGETYGEPYAPYVPPPPVAPDLTGTWVGACATAGKGGQRLSFESAAETWSMTVESFKDGACAKRTQALRFTGTLQFGAQSASATGAWDATFTFATREITVDDAKTAKAVGKACKLKKLKKGQTVSLHEQGCPKLGVLAADACAAEHNLVHRSGSRLSFGVRPADNDLCAEAKRPTAVDTQYQLAFQWKATGIPECDAYFVALDQYLNCPQFPADARDQVFDSVKMLPDQFAQSGSAVLDACKQGADAMRQGMAAMGC